MTGFSKEDRQIMILQILMKVGRVTVAGLSHQFDTSKVTIRRDLSDLEAIGKLHRTYRGALPVVNTKLMHLPRMQEEVQSKKNISLKATELIKPGETIFIGPGSITTYLIDYLAERKDLTIITNAISIAIRLSVCNPEITTIFIGGMVRKSEIFCFGHILEKCIDEFHINKMLFGAQAINTKDGWTTDFLPEITSIRKIIGRSQELIILADHTKIGRVFSGRIAPLSSISLLVTDASCEKHVLEEFEKNNLPVLIAS